MNEYAHLINDYLVHNSKIMHYGFGTMSAQELNNMLRALCPFERPDMIALTNDKAYILEHFEFDASQESRKGMKGAREERLLEKRAEKQEPNSYTIDKADYLVSKENFQKNFERHFCRHYKQIAEYKRHLTNSEKFAQDTEVVVGFFIENSYPPFYGNGEKHIGELLYFKTRQFWGCFNKHKSVDFILFGCYFGGMRQLFCLDHASQLPLEEQIDLSNSAIVFSHLNNNEVAWYGNFTVEIE